MIRRGSWGRRAPARATVPVDPDLAALFRSVVVRTEPRTRTSDAPRDLEPPREPADWPTERQVLLAERAELRRVLGAQCRAAAELQADLDERNRLARAQRDDLERASAAVADLTARLHRLAGR